MTEGNKVKHSCIDISTKDQRKMSFILRDYKKSTQIKDTIRSIAFKEQVPIEAQFNNYFARVHYDYVAKNTVKYSQLDPRSSKQPSVVEINRLAWARAKDPLVEFINRQKVPLFEEKLTIGQPEKARKAVFQVYDNSLFKLCPTYPITLLLPAQASQAVI